MESHNLDAHWDGPYQEWINVDRVQPEPWEKVLVSCEGGWLGISQYYGKQVFYRSQMKIGFFKHRVLGLFGRKKYGKFGRYFDASEKGYHVKFWMYLPE